MKNFNTLGLFDSLRTQDIQRWTTVPMTRRQNVAEHTFNVIVIARCIAKILEVNDANIIKYAFDHDLDEIITGDLPTPAKSYLGIKDHYAGVSRERCNSYEIRIVKLADLLETAWYAINYATGPIANEIRANTLNRLVGYMKELPPELLNAADRIGEEMNIVKKMVTNIAEEITQRN